MPSATVLERPQHGLFGASAYDVIKQRILGNEYPGGFHLLEQQLALDFDMSRTPLKEALVRLESDGLIQIVPRRGIRVIPLTANDIHEIYTVLSPLETLAAELIAIRTDNKHEVAALEAQVEAMRRALNKSNLGAWAEADEKFHRCLVDMSGNSRLSIAARTLLDQSQRFRMFTLRLREKPVRSTDNHASLVQAIKEHDPKRARLVHMDHKADWKKNMEALLERFSIKYI